MLQAGNGCINNNYKVVRKNYNFDLTFKRICLFYCYRISFITPRKVECRGIDEYLFS